MSVSASELNQIEAFFASVDLPDSIKVNDATIQHNVADAVRQGIALIRSGEMASRLEECKMDILRGIKAAILAQQQ
jgi:hypothetical protein